MPAGINFSQFADGGVPDNASIFVGYESPAGPGEERQWQLPNVVTYLNGVVTIPMGQVTGLTGALAAKQNHATVLDQLTALGYNNGQYLQSTTNGLQWAGAGAKTQNGSVALGAGQTSAAVVFGTAFATPPGSIVFGLQFPNNSTGSFLAVAVDASSITTTGFTMYFPAPGVAGMLISWVAFQ